MHSLKFRLLTTALAAGLAIPVGFAIAQNANQSNQQEQQDVRQQTRPAQPNAAQQTESQQARQAEEDAQQAREAAERQAQQEGRERPTETETAREYADQQQQRGEDRGDAMRHFLAGYYAGYSDGYFDGSDDLVFHIIELQRSRSASRDFTQMHPEHARHRGMAHERLMYEMSGRGPRREQQLTGRVLNTREVSFRQGAPDHMVVFVETNDGVGRIVDLGPVDQLQNVQIEEGAEISVRGETFMSGDRRILAASQAQIGDETINIGQRGQTRQQSGAQQNGTQRRAFRPEDTQQTGDRSAIGGQQQQRRSQQGQTGDTTQRQQEQQRSQQAQPRGVDVPDPQGRSGDSTQRKQQQQQQQRDREAKPQQRSGEQQEREQEQPRTERPESQP